MDIRWAIRCQARRKTGGPCGNYAIRGGFVCVKHGGRAPQVARAARERLLQLGAMRLLTQMQTQGAEAYRLIAAMERQEAARIMGI